MRAAGPLQVTIAQFGRSRAAVFFLVGLAVAAVWGWMGGAHERMPGIAAMAGVASLVVAVAAAVSVWRLPATSLRWDGQLWHWGPPATPGSEPSSGDLVVMLDLGNWMLVKLLPSEPPGGRRWATGRWLPIQREGLAPQWHALRCTVYSPRLSPPTPLPQRQDLSPE